MSDLSGANVTGHPSVIVYETVSGVIVHVTPLSPFIVQAIRQRSEEEFPYPDPEPYRMAVENAADPSIKVPAEDNPEYQELCKPIDVERAKWRVESCLDLACVYPAFPSREHMLAHFRPQLEKLKAVATLPDDEWQAVLKCCVFTGSRDRSNILDLALQNETIPLTPAEVVEGIRFFRVEVQK